MTFLDKILLSRRESVDRAKRRVDVRALMEHPSPVAIDFVPAIKCPGRLRLIAEFKRSSPSAGKLSTGVSPTKYAVLCRKNGAAALSILTEETFFNGSLEDIRLAREGANLPMLRKDFIIDPYQVYESRARGASAILLIVRILPQALLEELAGLARELGMAALVEVHHERELERALSLRPPLVGINSRDLDTLALDSAIFERLRPSIPPGVVAVAESGIRAAADVVRMKGLGFDAILVGETILRSGDPERTIRELSEGGR